jgi:hypothetical protein
MTLLRKSIPLFLVMVMMFTIMYALLGAAASANVVIPSSSSAFAQTASLSLAQDIIDSVQQEETDQSSSSSSAADDTTQTNTNTQSFDLDLEQEVEAEVENTAEQATGNLALPDQDAAQEQEEDTTPPTLIVPEDITEEATSSDGTVVRFEVIAEDNVDGAATLDEENTLIQDDDVGGSVTISCDSSSGSVFPIGNTEVECTATDEAGNIGRASSTVTVNPVESPRENGKIAFISNREGGNWDIYVMNADGSEQTRLTNNPASDTTPDWSPDGTKIAFTSYRPGDGEVFVMNADDGSEQTNISNNRGSADGDPDWGPATDTD